MKKILFILLIVIVLAIAAGLIWKFLIYQTPEEKAAKALEGGLESATTGIMPEITGSTNPLGEGTVSKIETNLPETNPLDKTNPFKELRVNPF